MSKLNRMAKGTTRAEQAARMRDVDGLSPDDIAEKFGWTIETTWSLISRGRKIDEFRDKHRRYQQSVYSSAKRHAGYSKSKVQKEA